MPKPYRRETGIMWVEQQQLLDRYIKKMKARGVIQSKKEVALAVGMEFDEFYQTICENPRTPLTRGKLKALESYMKRGEHSLFQDYLQEWHCDDDIIVKDLFKKTPSA